MRQSQAGQALIETLVASAVIVTLAAGVAQVAVMTAASVRTGGAQGMGLFLAAQKMEQLASLAWTYDPALQRVSDATTNLAVDPPAPGGTGLLPSGPIAGAGAGYTDYLSRDGAWIGSGSDPPAGTAFVRRWSVTPIPWAPDDTRLLQVAVAATGGGRVAGGTALRPNDPGVVWLATVRVRP